METRRDWTYPYDMQAIYKGGTVISFRPEIGSGNMLAGIMLLYAENAVPDRSEIVRVLETEQKVSFATPPARQARGSQDPANSNRADQQAGNCGHPSGFELVAELVQDGLTFDLLDISTALEEVLPQFDLSYLADPLALAGLRRSLLLAAGPHITAAAGQLPVLYSQFMIARTLLQTMPQAQAVAWSPSLVVSGRQAAESWINHWLEGGALPSPLLVACHRAIDAGLQTVGLDFLVGQEIRIEPELIEEETEAARLAMLLFDRFAHQGRLEAGEVLTGIGGEALSVEPSANGRFIRVRAA